MFGVRSPFATRTPAGTTTASGAGTGTGASTGTGGTGAGGAAGANPVPPIPAVVSTLRVSLDDVFNRRTVAHTVMRERACGTCHGHGTANRRPRVHCGTCGGNGQTVNMRTVGSGYVQYTQQPCRSCDGKGVVADEGDRCTTCRGSRSVRGPHTMKVQLPVGVESGTALTFAGEGTWVAPGPGAAGGASGASGASGAGSSGGGKGACGDVVLIVEVQQHPTFKRVGPGGRHLVTEVTIPLSAALCGCSDIRIVHMDRREIILRTPAGAVVAPGSRWTVPQEGMMVVGRDGVPTGRRGDLIVVFDVAMPGVATATPHPHTQTTGAATGRGGGADVAAVVDAAAVGRVLRDLLRGADGARSGADADTAGTGNETGDDAGAGADAATAATSRSATARESDGDGRGDGDTTTPPPRKPGRPSNKAKASTTTPPTDKATPTVITLQRCTLRGSDLVEVKGDEAVGGDGDASGASGADDGPGAGAGGAGAGSTGAGAGTAAGASGAAGAGAAGAGTADAGSAKTSGGRGGTAAGASAAASAFESTSTTSSRAGAAAGAGTGGAAGAGAGSASARGTGASRGAAAGASRSTSSTQTSRPLGARGAPTGAQPECKTQ